MAMESDIAEATQNAKSQAQGDRIAKSRVARWLAEEGSTPKGMYADPMNKFQ